MTPEVPDMPCKDFVEQVTDYLDGAFDEQERRAVDAHLATCAGCRTVLGQWREVIRLSGRLADAEVESGVDDLDPTTRHRLLTTFRRHHPT